MGTYFSANLWFSGALRSECIFQVKSSSAEDSARPVVNTNPWDGGSAFHTQHQ